MVDRNKDNQNNLNDSQEKKSEKKTNCCCICKCTTWFIISGLLLGFVITIFATSGYFKYETNWYKYLDLVTFLFYSVMVIIILFYLVYDRDKSMNFTTLELIIILLLAIGDGTFNLTRFFDQLNEFFG